MSVLQDEFSFKAQDDSKPILVRVVRGSSESPFLWLEVHGLIHPLLRCDTGYIGDETKNPRHRYAIEILDGIFQEWLQGLPEEVRQAVTVQPLRNSSADAKIAVVRLPLSLAPQTAELLYKAAGEFKIMVQARTGDIIAAFDKGVGEITLTDPNEEMLKAIAKALHALDGHPNLADVAYPSAVVVDPHNDLVH